MKNKIKSIILFAAAIIFALGTQAKQADDGDEANALQVSLAMMLHKYSSNADTIAKDLSKRFLGNAKIQTAIARAYYRNNDKANMCLYLDKAIKANPKYADAYILYGKLYDGTCQMNAWSADTAAYWFNKAIEIDSKNPEPYLDLASAQSFLKDSLASSKATLERLRLANPSYDVDAAIADLYNKEGNDTEAAKFFDQTDPYKLDESHMAKYIQNLYWSQQYDKATEMSKIAIERFPQNKGFDRVCAWSLIPIGGYKDALKYGQSWIDSAPADSLNSIDMFTMGSANLALNNTDKGFEYFAKIAKMDDYFVPQMKQQITNSVAKIRNDLVEQKQYDKAADMYKKFIEAYPDSDEAYRLYTLSQIYRSEMLEHESDREPYLEKLFNIYKEIESRYPNWENIHYVYYPHARYTYSFLDPENTKCLAKPYYQKLYDCLSKQKDLDKEKRNMIVEACLYFGTVEYFTNHNLKQARVWWTKVLGYDPDNENAKTALNKVKK